jgi:hypothetical protein
LQQDRRPVGEARVSAHHLSPVVDNSNVTAAKSD